MRQIKWFCLWLAGREQESNYLPDFRKNAAADVYNRVLTIENYLESQRENA